MDGFSLTIDANNAFRFLRSDCDEIESVDSHQETVPWRDDRCMMWRGQTGAHIAHLLDCSTSTDVPFDIASWPTGYYLTTGLRKDGTTYTILRGTHWPLGHGLFLTIPSLRTGSNGTVFDSPQAFAVHIMRVVTDMHVAGVNCGCTVCTENKQTDVPRERHHLRFSYHPQQNELIENSGSPQGNPDTLGPSYIEAVENSRPATVNAITPESLVNMATDMAEGGHDVLFAFRRKLLGPSFCLHLFHSSLVATHHVVCSVYTRRGGRRN